MSEFEYKDYFNFRFCTYGDENKVVSILDSYTQKQVNLSDVNQVFELYHTKLFFDNNQSIPNWSEEKYNEYKAKTASLYNILYKFFKTITEDNLVEIFNSCYFAYRNDFRHFFFRFKIYECISKSNICNILKNLHWNTFDFLENKNFVELFDEEITLLLEEQQYGLQFVVSFYLEETEKSQKFYIPKSFTIDKRIKIIEDYLNGDDINPKNLQLIINAKHTNELPITPKIKKLANKRNIKFWDNIKTDCTHAFEFLVNFGSYKKEVNYKLEKNKWIFEYDSEWIKNNLDYPTLLNNFIYLFEYVDSQMRYSYLTGNYNKNSFIDLFTIKGKGMYKKDITFDMLDKLSDMQMLGYVNELKLSKIHIEKIIKWFFEEYLYNEFGIKNFICSMPHPTDSIVSKCKTLPSAIDGVLSKFKMLCEDGEIDLELFEYITNSPRIKDVPSLINNKYCYINSSNLSDEINMLFLNKSMLGYTEKTEAKYDTFFKLIKNERIKLSDYRPYQLQSLNWLIDRHTIYLEGDIIVPNVERILILKEFYEKGVISLQHFGSPQLKEMIKNNEVIIENNLLTRPECQYFDYLLNNSEFSDGKALRNRYIHDSIVLDEKVMNDDYTTLLKIMVILIIKINDEFCIKEMIKQKGDFYEL